ncbi:MAG: rhodanese-like domain-containing protein [Actinomycetota bacterium]|nr:rhodanese-like domain-containing protein [Actinomycetota bacterium]
MFFRQFHLPSLGHASYLVGDESSGEALILDPRRDVDAYFEVARNAGLYIRYALDSHGHNDYLSGLTELRQRADVEVLAYAHGGYTYEHTPVEDGQRITMGDVGIEILHTPGHTPEHVSLLVYDGAADPKEPALMLSGGAVLVGDLARPDLLGGEDRARAAATEYCHTIQEKILFQLPDHLEIFPTHVAGSLCGGNIGSRLSTTLGYEQKTNAILARVSSSEGFVEECIRLDNLPAVPPYWKRMRRQNMAGVRELGVLREPPALNPDDFEAVMNDGAVVVDARDAEAFAGLHIPGALNVGLGSSFSTWAGTFVPDGARLLLIVRAAADLWDASWQLLRIGYDLPVGWLAGGMYGWRVSAKPLETAPQMTVHELHERLADPHLCVLDVRQPAEWAEGHIAGARFITGAELPQRLDEVPRDELVAVICGSGYRSSAAGSLLRHHGYDQVVNVIGGMSAWSSAAYVKDT